MVRDEALAGSRNPMLARHGRSSEARQYSGRAVDANWRARSNIRVRNDRDRHDSRTQRNCFSHCRAAPLTVIDPKGEQVADLLAFNADDIDEVISSGRTLDYAESIYLTMGNSLYSNRSRVMLEIIGDTVGRHDFLLTPCSVDTFIHFTPICRRTAAVHF